jgi:hypothetical protein
MSVTAVTRRCNVENSNLFSGLGRGVTAVTPVTATRGRGCARMPTRARDCNNCNKCNESS